MCKILIHKYSSSQKDKLNSSKIDKVIFPNKLEPSMDFLFLIVMNFCIYAIFMIIR